VLLAVVASRWFGTTSGGMFEVPSAEKVVSNLSYLQNVLGQGDIVLIFWTLCIEVQFYAVFALLVYLAARMSKDPGRRAKPLAALLVASGAVRWPWRQSANTRSVGSGSGGICSRWAPCWQWG